MKHTLKISIFLVLIFLGAQIIGLGIVNSYIDKDPETGELTFDSLPLGLERPEVEKGSSLLMLVMGAIVIGTIILLLFIKFKLGILWRIWFFLAIFLTLTVALGSFLPIILAAILGLVLGVWKVVRPNIYVQNLTELFVYSFLLFGKYTLFFIVCIKFYICFFRY